MVIFSKMCRSYQDSTTNPTCVICHRYCQLADIFPRSGRRKIQNLNSLISLVNIIKVALKSCLKWQTTNQVFDTFVQSKQKCSRMAKRAGFRAGFRRTLKITLLYQFHARKALFKVPKICNINFWLENDLPSPLALFQKIIRFGRGTLPLVWYCYRVFRSKLMKSVENHWVRSLTEYSKLRWGPLSDTK